MVEFLYIVFFFIYFSGWLIEVITMAEMYFILNFARDIFYDSDDDEENETVKIAKVE